MELLLPERVSGEVGKDGSNHDATAKEHSGLQQTRDVVGRSIPATDLAGLDAYEGFDPSHRAAENAYLRRTIEVTGTDGTMHSNVWCYFVRQPHGHIPPSALYGHALLAGARERHLPPSHIKTLSALLRPDTEN